MERQTRSLTSDQGGQNTSFCLVEFRRWQILNRRANRGRFLSLLLSLSLSLSTWNAIIGSDIDGDVVHVRQFHLRLCVLYEVMVRDL